MKSANGERSEPGGTEKEVPVCLRCLEPADPANHYCPHCGEATGQFTHYIPFVNIPWQTRIWGQVWRQMWSGEGSVPGRLFRLFMIVWNVPIMLVGLIPELWGILKREKNRRSAKQDPNIL